MFAGKSYIAKFIITCLLNIIYLTKLFSFAMYYKMLPWIYYNLCQSIQTSIERWFLIDDDIVPMTWGLIVRLLGCDGGRRCFEMNTWLYAALLEPVSCSRASWQSWQCVGDRSSRRVLADLPVTIVTKQLLRHSNSFYYIPNFNFPASCVIASSNARIKSDLCYSDLDCEGLTADIRIVC